MNTKKPNILWLSHNVPYPPKTGVLQRNYNLLKEASKIGNIYLVAVYQKNILPVLPDLEEINQELGKLCKEIKIIYLPIDTSKLVWMYTAIKSIFTKDPFGVNWIKSNKIKDAIQDFVNEVEFDIDTWPMIDPYLEIEAPSEGLVIEYFEKLGFDYSKAYFGSADIIYRDEYGIDILPIKKLRFSGEEN